MRLQRVPLIVLSLAAAAVLVGVYLRQTSPAAQAERERAARAAAALEPVASPRAALGALPISARTVQRRALRLQAELSAVLGPVRRVQLAAEVEGRVTRVLVEEYQTVEADALLVQVERSLLEAALQRAEAVVGRARADHDLARLELQRQRGLRERRATSDADVDRSRSTELARAADLKEATAALADARVRLAKTEIRAPFAGVVQSIELEPGAYLRQGDPVAEVIDLSEIEIEVGVTDREVVAIRRGDPVELEVEVFPGETFTGAVQQLGRAVRDETQKFPVMIRVANPDGRLLAGMIGRLRFDLGERRPSIRIPREAAQKEFEIDYVFVVVAHGDLPVVERRRIKTRPVPFRPDLIEVVEGLREGERIATSRVRELRDGLVVQVLGNDS